MSDKSLATIKSPATGLLILANDRADLAFGTDEPGISLQGSLALAGGGRFDGGGLPWDTGRSVDHFASAGTNRTHGPERTNSDPDVTAADDGQSPETASPDSLLFMPAGTLTVSATAALVVTSNSDEAVGSSLATDQNDGNGLSLREAIAWNQAGDTIGFDNSLNGQTLTLTGGELALTQDISIDGDIDGDNKADIVISGGNDNRVFNISGTGTDADLRSLTLANGFSFENGGAIYAGPGVTVDLIDSTLRDNTADYGGGIASNGTLTIINSTISGNVASAYGGGMFLEVGQTANVINSTIYGNSATYDGGGIDTNVGAILNIYASTITNNTAGSGRSGGGINLFNGAVANLANSVVAQNMAGNTGDDVGETGLTNSTLNADSSFFGASVSIDSGANNINGGGDPLLGQLLDNGGTVLTLSPLDGSQLIGAGDTSQLPLDDFDLDGDGNFTETLPLDGRDQARTNGVLDIGAVEQIADETITGTDEDDVLVGGGGNDILIGGGGGDVLNGGADIDTASYQTSVSGVTVSLSNGTTSGGDAAGDSLIGIENLTGSNLADLLIGDGLANVLTGGGGVDDLRGNAGIDTLSGGSGNDTLNGGTGADTMTGGGDSDSYFVDNAGDVIVELAGGGTADVVRSTVSYTLGGNVEQLRLLGSANIDATGNSEDNLLVGNSGNNRLNGSAGIDTMQGGDGDDIYTIDNAGDVAIEGGNLGSDRVNTSISLTLGSNIEDGLLLGTANLNLTGNAFGNFLIGNAGNNILDGGAGVDTLAGKEGDDTYIVDLPTDFISEQAAEGTDLVQSTVNYSLRPNIENLTLLGTNNLQGIGNAENNILIGNAAANRLNGSTGADTMMGGDGNDLYSVDDAGDIIIENANEGIDTVLSFATQVLGANVERLYLFGTADIDATGNDDQNGLLGNDGNNALSGMGGNDLLFGGLGNDIMTGGTGFDTFFFRTALDGVNNVDTLIDFSHADDTMRLDSSVFTGLTAGLLSSSAFIISTAAGDADDRIIYDDTTGDLFFDADGNGAGAQVQFATLEDIPTDVLANDFLVF